MFAYYETKLILHAPRFGNRYCDSSEKCQLFRIYVYKVENQLVPRHPAPPNSYPNLISFDKVAHGYKAYNFMGHGILIDPLTILTSGTNIFVTAVAGLSGLMFFRMGSDSRNTSYFEATCCYNGGLQQTMPGYDPSTMAYNYGLIHLIEPITFDEKIKTIPLAKDGQNFTGPCRYASWMKKRWLNPHINSLYFYSDDLEEASLTILPEKQCRQAGFLEPAICTAQVLCGSVSKLNKTEHRNVIS
ncbi:unnamed protein product [Allacma fusca]|uniref:Peptidase S1 domain-containing protein n=1 Tax=Allacma fusca TaxID=39272 RepID=A0A8J2KP26_9HEXA|nr:unnamed protein product [Allacma fusca]